MTVSVLKKEKKRKGDLRDHNHILSVSFFPHLLMFGECFNHSGISIYHRHDFYKVICNFMIRIMI